MAIRTLWHEFPGRRTVAAALADEVAAKLTEAVEKRGAAVLVVSGGTTPALFLRALSVRKLDWSKVTVSLADERMVPPPAPRSNEHFVTRNLLQGEAARANFVGLYVKAASLADAAAQASAHISQLAAPFDVAILGMGTDGHTASLFQDAGNYAALIDPAGAATVMPVESASAGEPRLTLTLQLLARTRHIFVHIEGLEKKELLLKSLAGAIDPPLPVGRLFALAADRIKIYWAPAGETS